MPSNSPSRNKTVAVFSASVLAAATVSGFVAYFNGDTYQVGTQEVTTASGSTVTAGGGTFRATNLSDAACRKDTSGRYYDCYQKVVLTNSGGCVAAGCGSKSYNPGAITKPYTGSGVIRTVTVSCDGQPVATTLSVGQVSALTASSSSVWLRKGVASGSLLINSTGAHLWSETTPYIKASAAVALGAGTNCLMTVVSDEMYNP